MKLRNIKNLRDIFLTINKVFYQILLKPRTTLIMNKDWDNLIILDACRYDMFKKVNKLPGKLSYIYSRGSSTGHFLAENFKDKYFPDTVYITANPMVDYYVKNSFYKVISVWKDGWHEPFQTILPETVLDFSLKANKTFGDKRLIIHFMQPHFPFIGEKSRNLIGEHEGIRLRNIFYSGQANHIQTVWHLFKMGKIDYLTLWHAYEENLEIVLQAVNNLLSNLKGKTIITSDHANLFGEWLFPIPLKEYGHPGGLYKKSLLKVPWHIIETGERKKIQPGQYKNQPSQQSKEVKEIKKRLEALGYF